MATDLCAYSACQNIPAPVSTASSTRHPVAFLGSSYRARYASTQEPYFVACSCSDRA